MLAHRLTFSPNRSTILAIFLAESRVAIMDDEREWTETKLVHEIISNLQSLERAEVDWITLGPEGHLQELIRVSVGDGQVFRLGIALISDDEAAAFDDLFEYM